MINYRAENLEQALSELRTEGVSVHAGMESSQYARFGWIMDPESNPIEMREPAPRL